jgi:hypothetical protein
MLERMNERVRVRAAALAQDAASRLAERARDALPPGISAAAEPDGILLSGRDLRRRMALDPPLRCLWQRLL